MLEGGVVHHGADTVGGAPYGAFSRRQWPRAGDQQVGDVPPADLGTPHQLPGLFFHGLVQLAEGHLAVGVGWG